MSQPVEPIATLLTPPGRGAIATVRVEGSDARALVERLVCCPRGVALSQRLPGSWAYGRWRAEPPEDLLVAVVDDSAVEIHSHGGHAAVERILAALGEAGCRIVDWRTWRETHESDPIAVEAEIALAQARTLRVARLLLAQRDGALGREIKAVYERLLANDTLSARDRLDALLRRAEWGVRLVEGFRVALVGPANVGKSSLMNALVGYGRAIVFNEPGTTRDALEADAAFDGWPVRLIDTAGLRESADPLEIAGMTATRARAATADLVLLVLDATKPTEQTTALRGAYPAALIVNHRADLFESPPPLDSSALYTSAITLAGLDDLARRLAARLAGDGDSPLLGVPFTARQQAALREARALVESGQLPAAATLLAERFLPCGREAGAT